MEGRLYDAEAVLQAGQITLAAAKAKAVAVSERGAITFIARIAGAGVDGAPTDTPVLTWVPYVAAPLKAPEEPLFVPLDAGNALLADQMARIAPNGNNKVEATASIGGLAPGTLVALVPADVSGGAATNLLTLDYVT